MAGKIMKAIVDLYRDFLYGVPIEETDYNKRYLKKFDLFTQYVDKDILLSVKIKKIGLGRATILTLKKIRSEFEMLKKRKNFDDN